MDWDKRINELERELYRLQGFLIPNEEDEPMQVHPPLEGRLRLLTHQLKTALFLSGLHPYPNDMPD
jgi:hypothetical protein